MVLGISIFIHELGHLLCGMLVGVKARIFSFGYGRGIWKKRIGETTYQITAIPIGGYVMFKGDQYGRRLKGKDGELLSTPPLKRMIPVLGGPLFNLILGFTIFFLIALIGDDNSWGNKIFIDKVNRDYSAAYKAGLRTGDRIVAINGKATETFEDIFTSVGLSGGEEIEVSYERKGETKSIQITPDIYSAGGRPTLGIEPYGERHIVVTFTYKEQIGHWIKSTFDPNKKAFDYFQKNFGQQGVEEISNKKLGKEDESPSTRAIAFLKDGDMILEVEGKPVSTVGELQTLLGQYQNQVVKIHLMRKLIPLISPWAAKEETVEVPVRGSDLLELSQIVDTKNPEFVLQSLVIASHDKNINRKLLNIRIDGRKFLNFAELKTYLNSLSTNEIEFESGELHYKCKFRVKPIGLLGFIADMKFEPEAISKKYSVVEALAISGEKVYKSVATSVRALGLLFRGMISVKGNLSGPVGILQSAGISLEYGWLFYFNFVANISIALMFINLLPIPIADGGHLVLYLYEAIAGKPLPPRAIETLFKIGFIFLLLLGVYVTYYDIMSRNF